MINALCVFMCSVVAFCFGLFAGIAIVLYCKDDRETLGELEEL